MWVALLKADLLLIFQAVGFTYLSQYLKVSQDFSFIGR